MVKMSSLCRGAMQILIFVFMVLSSSARAKGSSPLLIEDDGSRRKNEPAGKWNTSFYFIFNIINPKLCCATNYFKSE